MDIISVHYDEIKSIFKRRSHNSGFVFNEDVFNDAFIKCAQKFGNNVITYDLTVKYFWVTYVNTTKAVIAKENRFNCLSLDTEIHDCVEPDNDYTNIYNYITDVIENEFSEHDMMLYVLYKFHGWSKQDLIDAKYDITGIDDKIKEIHKFIKTYCKNRKNTIVKES